MSKSVYYNPDFYAVNLLKTFNDYRESRTLCDVILIVEGARVAAHGLILSAASPYLNRRLREQTHHARPVEIRLDDVEAEALTAIVDYLYTAEITIDRDLAFGLLPAVCLFQIDDLKTVCCDVLKSCLSLETTARTRKLAADNDCTDLQQACDYYIQGKIFSDPEFLEQGFEDFVTNVCPLSDVLNEDQMCHAVTSWVNYRKEKRQPFVTMFLQKMVHLSDRIQQTFETDEPTVQLTNKSVDDVCSQPSPTLSSETVFQSYHPPLKREALGYDHHQTMMSPIVQKSHSSKKMTHQLTSSAAKIPGISTFQKASNSNRDHAHVKTESVEDFSDLSTNLLDTDDSNLQLNVMPDVLMQRSSFNRAALQSVSETRNPRSLSGMEKLQQMVSQAKSPESTLTYADSEIYLRHHADSQFSPDSLLHTSGYQADIFKQKDSRAPRFSCEICGDHFSSKSSLTNHHRIHTGDRPYKCKVCGNCFSQSGTLVNHVKIHTNAKAHKCEICGKGFNRAFVLREHMRTHTKEKPFKCCFCWSKFGQRSKLKAHMRIHTGELVPKLSVHGQHGRTSPLKHLKSHTASSINHPSCSICYKVCDNDVELIRHMQSHQISSAPSIRVGTCTDQVIEIDDSPQRSPLSEES